MNSWMVKNSNGEIPLSFFCLCPFPTNIKFYDRQNISE